MFIAKLLYVKNEVADLKKTDKGHVDMASPSADPFVFLVKGEH